MRHSKGNVVLGFSRGIGGEVCRAFREAGAELFCDDIKETVAQEIAELFCDDIKETVAQETEALVNGTAAAPGVTKRGTMETCSSSLRKNSAPVSPA